MPKSNTKAKGGRGPTKKGARVNANKWKVKHIDPCLVTELHTSVCTSADEVVRPEEPMDQQPLLNEHEKKKPTKKHPVMKVDGVVLKPGTTAAQVKKIANKMRHRVQKTKEQEEKEQEQQHQSKQREQLLEKAPSKSFDDGEEEEEDESGESEEEEEVEEKDAHEEGGSGEDFSDTANERQTEYRKGGYHPVELGEVYNNRYRVARKLGWGYFSTVWLVWDYVKNKFQAMKVQKSARHYTEAAYDEMKLLGEIMSADPDGTRCCARLNDYFEHTGPNGTHVCMVFDVYGEDLLSLIERYEYHGVPLPIVKCISQQILVALEYVHSLDIIHTDLKPENVLLSEPKHAIVSLMKRFRPPPLHQRSRLVERDPKTMTKSQRRRYYKKLRASEKNGSTCDTHTHGGDLNAVAERDNEISEKPCLAQKQGEATSDTETDSEWEVKRLHHVVVADFGNSCWTYRQFTDEVQTRQYRSPEVILGEPYSTSIDLWSAACMIFELITGEFLFDPRKGSNYSRDEDHLALMSELLGELPESMRLGDGKYRAQFYNSRGKLRNIRDLNFWSLDDVLYRKHKFTRKKASEIAEFLLPMLEFDPQRRATAAEMLSNFKHFFEVKEDDYSPLCFVSSDPNCEQTTNAANDLGSSDVSTFFDDGADGDDDASFARRGEYSDDEEEEDEEEDAMLFWAKHPILNEDSLESRGLTILDIHAVLSGKQLENSAAHASATEVIRLLSEEVKAVGDEHPEKREKEKGFVSNGGDYSSSTSTDAAD